MGRNHVRSPEDRRRWERVRRAAFRRDKYRCRECGRAGRLEAHHEPPLERGGDPFDLCGIVTLCRDCHIRRHQRDCNGMMAKRAAWRVFVWE